MRAAAFAFAILLGGTAAVAQTTDTTEQTQTGWTTTATTTTTATPMVVQPSNAAPERDARGIAVISAPAVVPIGYNGTTGDAVGGPLLDPTTGQPIAAASSQPCTRTVTDHCVQTYERRRAR
jgi:hypothetical protein